MNPFLLEIAFAEPLSNNQNVLVICGKTIHGEIANGTEGSLIIGEESYPMKVLNVAFLKNASPESIMFSAGRPANAPSLESWAGSHFSDSPDIR